jgi:Fe-S oxidoreductase
MGAVEATLRAIPGLDVRPIESSCCGMSGAFGYGAATIDVSLAMGELALLPAVRKAGAGDLIVADGTSCRHQIHDGAGREALHVARVLADGAGGAAAGKPTDSCAADPTTRQTGDPKEERPCYGRRF